MQPRTEHNPMFNNSNAYEVERPRSGDAVDAKLNIPKTDNPAAIRGHHHDGQSHIIKMQVAEDQDAGGGDLKLKTVRRKKYSWLVEKLACQEWTEMPIMTWCLVFDYPNRLIPPGELPMTLPDTVSSLLSAKFLVEHHVSTRDDEIFLVIGLTHAQLQDEATYHMVEDNPLMCRVRGDKPMYGCIPYHKKLEKALAPGPGEGEDDERLTLIQHRTAVAGNDSGASSFRFSSGQAQRIARHRLERRLWDPDVKSKDRKPGEMLARVKAVLADESKWFTDDSDDHGHGQQMASIARWQMIALLEGYGCTLSHDASDQDKAKSRQQVMEEVLPKCQGLYKKYMDASMQERDQSSYDIPGTPCSVNDLRAAVRELDKKTGTPCSVNDLRAADHELDEIKNIKMIGEEDVGIAFLKYYFPLHHDAEIGRLRRMWGHWGLLTSCSAVQPKPFWPRNNHLDDDKEGCMGRQPKPGAQLSPLMAWRVNLFEQPYEEVRDYYGDHVALYFVWIGKYTKYLTWPAIFGFICQLGTFSSDKGVDGNWLLLPYSIFLAFWATIFLQMWERAQIELSVLWGSRGFEAQEKPRIEFVGGAGEKPTDWSQKS
eukprot:SAG31_NODE_2713_length_5205_cov_2.328241_4_plen_597_part_00